MPFILPLHALLSPLRFRSLFPIHLRCFCCHHAEDNGDKMRVTLPKNNANCIYTEGTTDDGQFLRISSHRSVRWVSWVSFKTCNLMTIFKDGFFSIKQAMTSEYEKRMKSIHVVEIAALRCQLYWRKAGIERRGWWADYVFPQRSSPRPWGSEPA